MKNEFIESYIKFLNLTGYFKVEYLSNYIAKITDDKNNTMLITNVFEDVIVTLNGEHLGNFRKDYDNTKEVWLLNTSFYF